MQFGSQLATLPATTTTLTTSGSPAFFGKPVTLTATVSPPDASGVVEFLNGTAVIGAKALSGGQAQITTLSLPAGTDQLQALYGGAVGIYQPSKSTNVNQVVNAVPNLGLLSETLDHLGGSSDSIALGDFNADGIADLAVASALGGVKVLLGNGNGTFQTAVSYTTAAHPVGVTVGDFNGDGVADLAVACQQGVLDVLIGSGNGVFQPATPYTFGTQFGGVAVGDFDGDGIADLVVADFFNGVYVLQGKGDGTFHAAAIVSSVFRSGFAAVGDFNGDGIADLVVTAYFDGADVLLGNGNGTFQTPVAYGPAAAALAIAVGDFNGDGSQDFAVADFNNGVNVLLGNGDGSFQNAVNYPVESPTFLAIGDLNGDGKLDLAVTREENTATDGTVDILLGNGDGTFQTAVPSTTGGEPVAVAIGDFDGNGSADLAVAVDANLGVLLAQAPARMTPNPGSTPQNALPGTTFGSTLSVTVRDPAGNAMSGVTVTFTAPATGVSGTFNNSQNSIAATTNGAGRADVAFTANSTSGGPYYVNATAAALTVQFALSNFSPCDVNGQGSITPSDARTIIGEVLGTNMPRNDVNGDGTINVADAQVVLVGVNTMSCLIR